MGANAATMTANDAAYADYLKQKKDAAKFKQTPAGKQREAFRDNISSMTGQEFTDTIALKMPRERVTAYDGFEDSARRAADTYQQQKNQPGFFARLLDKITIVPEPATLQLVHLTDRAPRAPQPY